MDEIYVGIDLGTTYSAVAVLDETGRPVVVPNPHNGASTTPSVIYLGEEPPMIGEDAKALGAVQGVAAFFKREMGSPYYFFEANGKNYSPTELSSILLAELKKNAESYLKKRIKGAVITVPAYFDESQRRATMQAGEQAGLEVLGIINEPTAAVLAFGLNKSEEERTILVYDLGGGTFDVTVAKINLGSVEVIATGGDHILGGKDWDDRIITWAAGNFRNEFGYDPLDDPIFADEIRNNCEEAKKSLTSRQNVKIRVSNEGKTAAYELSRETFEQLTQDLLGRTRTLCEDVLHEAGLDWKTVNGVLLVGGSTRMAQVPSFIESFCGKKPLTGVNVDEAVALGAALRAAELRPSPQMMALGGRNRVTIRDVMSHSLGMVAESDDRSAYVNSILISKNTPIPQTQTRPYTLATRASGDNELEVYMLQGESPRPWECKILGKYVFSGLRHVSGSKAVLDVNYSYDENGVIQTSAAQRGYDNPLPLRIEPVPEDMSWLRQSPLSAAQPSVPEKVTVYLAIDLSWSMVGQPIKEAAKAAVSFVDRLDLSRFSVGIITFASKAKTFLKPSQDLSKIKSLLKLLPGMVGGGTCNKAFEELLSQRQKKERCFVVVLTDGAWDSQDCAIADAQQCKARGIEIIAMGFGEADYNFLKRIATSDENALFTDLSQLEASFSKIAQVFNETSGSQLTAAPSASSGKGLLSFFK